MFKTIRILFTIGLLTVFISAYAEEAPDSASIKEVANGFTRAEQMAIRNYLDGNAQQPADTGIVYNKATLKKMKEMQLPPGLTKRKELPPGLAAQLKRDGTLPPGLAKRNLPEQLEQQLPPVRAGYERSILEDMTVVLIETATNRIIDLILVDEPTPETAKDKK